MTTRMWVLFGALIIAAMPLLWFSADPNAGDILLQLTQPGSVRQLTPKNAPEKPQQAVGFPFESTSV